MHTENRVQKLIMFFIHYSNDKIWSTFQYAVHIAHHTISSSIISKTTCNTAQQQQVVPTNINLTLQQMLPKNYHLINLTNELEDKCTVCGRKWVTNMAAAYKTYGKSRQQEAYFSTQKRINIASKLQYFVEKYFPAITECNLWIFCDKRP